MIASRQWLAGVTLVVAAVASACAGGGEEFDTSLAAVDDNDVRVEATDGSDPTASGDGSKPDQTPASTAVGVEEIPSRITRPAQRAGSESTDDPTADSTTTTTAARQQGNQGQSTGEASKSVSPVTTVPGLGGGVASLYKGFLGTLDRNERIVDPLGPPPSARSGVQPLTGLAGSVPNRPAAIVKIDNGPAARPQSGLNAADIVIEEEVEGGVTRFAAVFHSTSATVGPVRSARTTDIGIINSFGSPLLMYSGANEVTEGLIRAQPTIQNRNAGTSSGYWRSSSRRAPSNLYTDTASHWASAGSGAPPPQFSYRSPGQGVPSSHKTAVPASSFSVAYRASTAGWTWNGDAWLRTQGGSPHMTSSGQQVSASNVVVIEAREVPTGMVDSTGSKVPEFVFVGAGDVTVFTDGKRIEGRWNKPSMAVAPTLMSGGEVIELTPGRTWIELVGAGKGLLR